MPRSSTAGVSMAGVSMAGVSTVGTPGASAERAAYATPAGPATNRASSQNPSTRGGSSGRRGRAIGSGSAAAVIAPISPHPTKAKSGVVEAEGGTPWSRGVV
ncbi:hypothetical protein SDC9_163147 [bioreactor metagenome]|uniref:Uncharacterized protein n=1 Tax=bioreactor metagenome TaxID=1076179 RepID=A0A645FN27_9ZZZZ